jgi:hypothetical protein
VHGLPNPTLSGSLSGPEGTDTLAGIDVVRFADGAAHFNASGPAGQVDRLYLATLGRIADPIGLGTWTQALESGAVKAGGVAEAFVGSPEFGAGVWVPDPEAADVLRLHMAVLDRLPDAAGLHAWAAARNGGQGLADVAGRFAASFEFQSQTGGLSNRGFVEGLYLTALDRRATRAASARGPRRSTPGR